ncbi:glycosyltransferase family 2 protein [Chamaesiphon sp. VAR_69_metabat_338]|uniref:glycosyltransferase family 2 protein n=1 Tax=Chamaesiphon sp. VAR_69_metabat_338 TaxID=2964704 RepID=UPI00286D82D0|nr:glycosyltransferase family 2 protein [Chamaesiphon sp. VAR_69_metabat_338]
MLAEITPLILTYNEAPNIDRTLQQLTWAQEIVIIDSYSTDETLAIIARYPQAKVIQHKFESFASQCNFGLSQIDSEWVLSLDADYILNPALIAEMAALSDRREIDAYAISFKYCVFGKPLRGTLYPPRKSLYRKHKAVYHNDGHAHRVAIDGNVGALTQYISHDDRKPVTRWFNAEVKYADLEVKKLVETPSHELSFIEKIRLKKVIAPLLVLVYCLIVKRGILDGWPGIYYASQRVLAELLLSIKLLEYQLYTSKVKHND